MTAPQSSIQARLDAVNMALLANLKNFRLAMLNDEPSVQYQADKHVLSKKVNTKAIIDNDFKDAQLQKTSEWMGLSAIETARKAIVHSDLSVKAQYQALQSLMDYAKQFEQVYHKQQGSDYKRGLAMADHAREYAYTLLLEHGVLQGKQSRKMFNQLRNAGVMWRLFDRMGVETTLLDDKGQAVHIESRSWPLVHPEQDKLLSKVAKNRNKNENTADTIIKRVQARMLEEGDPTRLNSGSQERDWYASNAQVTKYRKAGTPTLTCWTNGDMRSKTGYYSQSLVQRLQYLNLKQLLLNATGIGLDKQDKKQFAAWCASKDVYGRAIQLTPICVLDDCQSYVDEKQYPYTGKLLRATPGIGMMLDEEHQNLKQRAAGIDAINADIEASVGMADCFIPLNTPLAVHGRKYFTYQDKQIPKINLIQTRLLDNYLAVLGLHDQSLQQEVGIDLASLKQDMLAYLQYPGEENWEKVTTAMQKLHSYATRFCEQDFADQAQVAKLVRSLSCLHDTLRHWKVYQNSSKVDQHEVLNLTSGLLTSVALMHDASMINMKCKSGKDRTGVMLQCVQANYDYWTTEQAGKTAGLPDLTSSYDCDTQLALEKFKVLLGSAAWTTVVAQDCQCPALKSLGSPVSTDKNANALAEKVLNLVGDGALTERQRAYIGADLLRFQKERSAFNTDFHQQVSTGKAYREAYDAVEKAFDSPNQRPRQQVKGQ